MKILRPSWAILGSSWGGLLLLLLLLRLPLLLLLLLLLFATTITSVAIPAQDQPSGVQKSMKSSPPAQ